MGVKTMLGVKLRAAPFACHEPGVVGDRLGIGELFASGEESITVIRAFAETPMAPAFGLTEETLSTGGDTASVVDVEELATVGALDPVGPAVWPR